MEDMYGTKDRHASDDNQVTEKQTNTIEKQSVKIENLQYQFKPLEGSTDNTETFNEIVTDFSDRKRPYSKSMITRYLQSLFLLYLLSETIPY